MAIDEVSIYNMRIFVLFTHADLFSKLIFTPNRCNRLVLLVRSSRQTPFV